MPLDDLLKLLDTKADEKWKALSLAVSKRELESEYKLIKKSIDKFKNL